MHVLQVAFARAQRFHHRTLIGVFAIDGEHFVRLLFHAVGFFDDYARARHRQFVTFTPHVFEQDGQVQFATAAHFKHVGVSGIGDFQRDVAHQLALQAFAYLAAGDELAFLAGEWRGVDLKIHGQRGLVHLQ